MINIKTTLMGAGLQKAFIVLKVRSGLICEPVLLSCWFDTFCFIEWGTKLKMCPWDYLSLELKRRNSSDLEFYHLTELNKTLVRLVNHCFTCFTKWILFKTGVRLETCFLSLAIFIWKGNGVRIEATPHGTIVLEATLTSIWSMI